VKEHVLSDGDRAALQGLTPLARFSVFEPGNGEEIRVLELKANDDRLFDVTGLGIVQPG
jgi:hypothetical protein